MCHTCPDLAGETERVDTVLMSPVLTGCDTLRAVYGLVNNP